MPTSFYFELFPVIFENNYICIQMSICANANIRFTVIITINGLEFRPEGNNV